MTSRSRYQCFFFRFIRNHAPSNVPRQDRKYILRSIDLSPPVDSTCLQFPVLEGNCLQFPALEGNPVAHGGGVVVESSAVPVHIARRRSCRTNPVAAVAVEGRTVVLSCAQ